MGWKFTAFVFLFAIWSLALGALIIGVPLLLYLFYRFWSDLGTRDMQSPPSGERHSQLRHPLPRVCSLTKTTVPWGTPVCASSSTTRRVESTFFIFLSFTMGSFSTRRFFW